MATPLVGREQLLRQWIMGMRSLCEWSGSETFFQPSFLRGDEFYLRKCGRF